MRQRNFRIQSIGLTLSFCSQYEVCVKLSFGLWCFLREYTNFLCNLLPRGVIIHNLIDKALNYLESHIKAFEIDLSRFTTIGLPSLGKEHLQDRVDTKFALHQSSLPSLLAQLENSHQVLMVEGWSVQPYKNLYFDDDRLSFYLHHHDKKGNRCKVRLREYASSNTVFLEVKQKINKDRTMKQRIPQTALHEKLTEEATDLIRQFSPANVGPLHAALWCDFNRITLLSPNHDERMTVDYNITIRNKHRTKIYDGLALIEVKHDSSRPSSFDAIARQNQIKKISISKYIMGTAHLHPELKQNNFRMKLLAIEKIMNKNESHHGI